MCERVFIEETTCAGPIEYSFCCVVVLLCCGGGFIVAKQRAAMREGEYARVGDAFIAQ